MIVQDYLFNTKPLKMNIFLRLCYLDLNSIGISNLFYIIVILYTIKSTILLIYSVYLILFKHRNIKPGPFSMCTSRIHPCLLGAVIMSS